MVKFFSFLTSGISNQNPKNMSQNLSRFTSVNKFKMMYDKKITFQKYTVTASRLLITLQTSIPKYSRTVEQRQK